MTTTNQHHRWVCLFMGIVMGVSLSGFAYGESGQKSDKHDPRVGSLKYQLHELGEMVTDLQRQIDQLRPRRLKVESYTYVLNVSQGAGVVEQAMVRAGEPWDACFLTKVTGKFEGGPERVEIKRRTDGHWVLEGQSNQPHIATSAVCIKYLLVE